MKPGKERFHFTICSGAVTLHRRVLHFFSLLVSLGLLPPWLRLRHIGNCGLELGLGSGSGFGFELIPEESRSSAFELKEREGREVKTERGVFGLFGLWSGLCGFWDGFVISRFDS